VTGWLDCGQIDRFFFIRYTDPSFHLRLRLHLTDMGHLGAVLRAFGDGVKRFEADGRIWKVQLDTYKREIERYGRAGILLAEEFFYHDSLAVLQMLAASADMDRDGLRWLWALRSIDEFLDGLGWGLVQKQALAQYLKEAFHREFHADKTLRSQLSNKYREHKQKVEAVLNRALDGQSPWRELVQPLRERQLRLRGVSDRLRQLDAGGRLEMPLHELLYSYVHMLVNRVVPADPRKHELVLYDLLFAYYRSLTERARHSEKNGEKNNKKITSAA
jgi:lantibiotic biosynthesis protein